MLERPFHSETIGLGAKERKGRCGFAQRPELVRTVGFRRLFGPGLGPGPGPGLGLGLGFGLCLGFDFLRTAPIRHQSGGFALRFFGTASDLIPHLIPHSPYSAVVPLADLVQCFSSQNIEVAGEAAPEYMTWT